MLACLLTWKYTENVTQYGTNNTNICKQQRPNSLKIRKCCAVLYVPVSMLLLWTQLSSLSASSSFICCVDLKWQTGIRHCKMQASSCTTQTLLNRDRGITQLGCAYYASQQHQQQFKGFLICLQTQWNALIWYDLLFQLLTMFLAWNDNMCMHVAQCTWLGITYLFVGQGFGDGWGRNHHQYPSNSRTLAFECK